MRTRILAAACVVALSVTAAACGSSSKSTTNTTTGPATTVAAAPVSPNGQCPFSGTTDSQSDPGAGSGTSVLDAVTPSASGCIDNVTFGFSKGLASSVTAYQTQPAGTKSAVLVVTFKGATLGGGLKPGTVLNPKSVNYVSKVQVTSASGDITFAITLDQQRPFLVSSSQVPAQLVVAIG